MPAFLFCAAGRPIAQQRAGTRRDGCGIDIIRQIYAGLADKSNAWQRDLAEDVVFADACKRLQAAGRDAFIQSFSGLLRALERVELRQLSVDGDDAAAVVSYDYVSPAGARLHQDDAAV